MQVRLALAIGLLLAGALPAQAWMTFVGRNVDTGERLGLGANTTNEDEKAQLAFLCTPQGLTATFLPDIKLTSDMVAADFDGSLAIAADEGAYDPFPVIAEAFASGDAREVRLRLSHAEAAGLAEYVLNASNGIAVSYRVGDEELASASYIHDGATIAIGAVLSECEGRGGRPKTK